MTYEEITEAPEILHSIFTPRTQAWGKYAWHALVIAEKAPSELADPEEDDYLEQLITMAALASLVEWFEDDYDLSDFEPSCEILEPRFNVSLFNFGRYIELNGINPFDSTGRPSADHAAIEALRERTSTIAQDLKDALGQSELFTSLWSLIYDDSISLPPSDEDLARTLNLDIDSEKGYRFERLQEL